MKAEDQLYRVKNDVQCMECGCRGAVQFYGNFYVHCSDDICLERLLERDGAVDPGTFCHATENTEAVVRECGSVISASNDGTKQELFSAIDHLILQVLSQTDDGSATINCDYNVFKSIKQKAFRIMI